ncbi:MAG: hypothetical protein KBA02_00335 [Paludibacteraceae bacterium]|nr:hypothetical protein [Paludibacteraceae bacterium]
MKWDDGLVLQELKPYEINLKFRAIKNILNGNIDNENLTEEAAISLTKTTLDRETPTFVNNTATINFQNVYVGIETTPAAQTINIVESAVEEGKFWIFKDESGGANVNNITIVFNGGINVNGSPNYVINTAYGSVRLYAISRRQVVTI